MHKYNANREPLILREYGRNVQKLVQQLNTIADKETRTRHAQAILKSMAILDANNKSQPENLQKHWDDLFIVSDYTLDIDSPYPMPEKGILNKNVERPAYVKGVIKFRTYGRNVERLVQKAIEATDATLQAQIIIDIIRLMKRFSSTWNGDNADCDTILAHLQQMAGNKLPINRAHIKSLNIFQSTAKEKSKNNNKRKKPA